MVRRENYYESRNRYNRPQMLEKALKQVEKEKGIEKSQKEETPEIPIIEEVTRKEEESSKKIALHEVEVKEIPQWKPKEPAKLTLMNMEDMVGKIRKMADSMESMLTTAQLMSHMVEATKKGKPMSFETMPMLAELMKAKSQPSEQKLQQTSYKKEEPQEVVETERESVPNNMSDMDVNSLVDKLMNENPDMANNPMAKMLFQMLNNQKKI